MSIYIYRERFFCFAFDFCTFFFHRFAHQLRSPLRYLVDSSCDRKPSTMAFAFRRVLYIYTLVYMYLCIYRICTTL